MKKLFLLGLLACAFAGNPDQAEAKNTNVLNFQGTLKDAKQEVVNKNMTMVFKIYDASTGGTSLWEESQTVAVKDGYFNVYLGSAQDFELNFAKELYLEITLDNGEVLPRTRLTASPFAFKSGTASTADTAEVAKSVVDGVIKWSNFEEEALKAGGVLQGTFPNPTINTKALVDGIEKGGIPGDKIAPGTYTHISATPAGKAGGDVAGSTFPNIYLKDNVIDTKHIKPGAVTNSAIANNAITSAKIADGEVMTADIADLNVTSEKLANEAVTTSKIKDNAVTSEKIGDGEVKKADIADDAIWSNHIKDGEVMTADIADLNVTSAKLADEAVTSAKLADNAVTSAKIADGEVMTADIADLNVTSEKLANEAVTNGKIADGTIHISKLAIADNGVADAGKLLILDASGKPTYDNLANGLNQAPAPEANALGQMYYWDGSQWKLSNKTPMKDGQVLKAVQSGVTWDLMWSDDFEIALPYIKNVNTFDKDEYNVPGKKGANAIDITKVNDTDYNGSIMNLVMENANNAAVRIASTGELAQGAGALDVEANATGDVTGQSKALRVTHNITKKSTDGSAVAEFANNVKEAVVDQVHKGIDVKATVENDLGTVVGLEAAATGGAKSIAVKAVAEVNAATSNVAVFATDDPAATVDADGVILAKGKGKDVLVVEGNTAPGKEYVATFTAPAGSRTVLIEGGADEDATIIGDDIHDKQDAALVVRNTSAGADRTAIKTYGDVWVNSKVRANKVYAYSEIRVGTGDVTTIITPPATADGPVNFDRTIKAPGLDITGNTVLGDDPAVDKLTVNAEATFNGATNLKATTIDDLTVKNTALIGEGKAGDKLTVNAASEFQMAVTAKEAVTAEKTVDVAGKFTATDEVELGGAAKGTTVKGTLAVDGAATFNEDVTVVDTKVLNANGGIQVDRDKFTVADNTGDVATKGNLTVEGNTTLGDAATDQTEIRGIVNLSDPTVMTTVKGTLQVDEAATLKSTLTVEGNTTLGDAATDQTDIHGIVNLSDPAVMTTVKGTLQVDEDATFGDDVTVDAGADLTLVEGDLTLTKGDATLTEGDLTLTKGDATLTEGNLTLTKGDATLTEGDLTLTKGNATLTEGDLTLANGNATITGNLTATGVVSLATSGVATTVNGTLTVKEAASFEDNIAVAAGKTVTAPGGFVGDLTGNATTATTAATATTATNIAGGLDKQIIVQTGVGTTGFIDAPAAGTDQVLYYRGGTNTFQWDVPPAALSGNALVDKINEAATTEKIKAEKLEDIVVIDTDNPAAAGDITGDFKNGLNIGAGKVTAAHLAASSVIGGAAGTIADGSITADDLATGSVGSLELIDGAVTSAKILDNTIVANDLANNAVTEAKIDGAAVTESKIATDAVTNGKIKAKAVTLDKLMGIADAAKTGYVIKQKDATGEMELVAPTDLITGNGIVTKINEAATTEKIDFTKIKAGDAVGKVLVTKTANTETEWVEKVAKAALADAVVVDGIQTAMIANAQVTADKLANDAVVGGAAGTIKDESITADDLADDAVTTTKIADFNVTPDKIEKGLANQVLVMKADASKAEWANEVAKAAEATTALGVTGNVINAGNLMNDAVVGGPAGVIKDNSITADDLANDAVTTAKIADFNVTVGKIEKGAANQVLVMKNDGSIAEWANKVQLAATAEAVANDAILTGMIQDGEVKTADIDAKAVTTDKINGGAEGEVLVSGASNSTSWTKSLTGLENLTATGTVALGGTAGNVTLGNAAAGTTTINGTATVGKKLTVSTGGIEVTAGGLTVTDGGATIKAGNFFVGNAMNGLNIEAANGNLTTDGTLTVEGKLTAKNDVDLGVASKTTAVKGALTVAEATTLTGLLTANGGITTTTLTATGATTLAGLTATEDVVLGGNTGKVTLGKAYTEKTKVLGDLEVDQATTLTGHLTANGGITTTRLTATGTVNLGAATANTAIVGTATVGKKLTVASEGIEVIAGGLTVTAGGLEVKAGGVKVPTGNLTVGATGTVFNVDAAANVGTDGTLTVNGKLTAKNDVDLGVASKTTAVKGALTVAEATTLTGELNANGGIKVDTDRFTVADATGNVATKGTLSVDGTTTLTGLLTANGGITTTTLTATGATTLAGLTATEDVVLGGNTGKVTLGKAGTEKTKVLGALEVAQATTLKSTLAAEGNVTVGKNGTAANLEVNDGTISLKNTGTENFSVSAEGNVTAKGTLSVEGDVTLGNANTDKTTITGMLKIDATKHYMAGPINALTDLGTGEEGQIMFAIVAGNATIDGITFGGTGGAITAIYTGGNWVVISSHKKD